jgi:hypothetical protein
MFIAPKRQYTHIQEPYPIPLQCAWLVREPEHMARITAEIIQYFNLGLIEPRRAARIAFFIEDGIEELLKMKPERRTTYVVGEGELFVDGKKLTSFELTQEKPAND